MYKAEYFHNLSSMTTVHEYKDWLRDNPNIDIVSVVNIDYILVVTYRERNAKLAN